MHIEIWSLGKENETHLAPAIDHYLKKTAPYNSVELKILSLSKKEATSERSLLIARESELVLKKLQPGNQLILLDERGKMLNSLEWAGQLQHFMNTGTKTLVLLIGGAYGVSDAVRQKAAQTWSLSNLIFPHQLVRLIVAEQLYRAFSILNNSPYHHT